MLIKIFSLVFLIGLLYPGYQAKAMEQQEFGVKSLDTLMHLAALVINKHKSNKNLNLNCLPQEFKAYCTWVQCYPLINKNCTSLKQLQEYDYLKINEENLERYNELLCKLIDMSVDIKPILSAIENDFTSKIMSHIFDGITMEDVNILLRLLIRRCADKKSTSIEKLALDEEMDSLINIIMYAFLNARRYNSLCDLLANYNLLPSLDYIVDASYNGTFLMRLVRGGVDNELFKLIINNEKNKRYNWAMLFSMCNQHGWTVLHDCVRASKDVCIIILELMREKEVLDDVINVQDNNGITPLIQAALDGNDEIVELLIHYGAIVDIACNDGYDADGAIGHYARQRIDSLSLYRFYQLFHCRILLKLAKNRQANKGFCCFT